MNTNSILPKKIAVYCPTKKEFDSVVGLYKNEMYFVTRDIMRNEIRFKPCYLFNNGGNLDLFYNKFPIILRRFTIISCDDFLKRNNALFRSIAVLWSDINFVKSGSRNIDELGKGLDDFWEDVLSSGFSAIKGEEDSFKDDFWR